MELERKINEIMFGLSCLGTYIERKGVRNLIGVHVVSETFYAKFLNILYGWNLESVNAEISNYEAIDLRDNKNKIMVQVTSNNQVRKLKKSLKDADKAENVDMRYKYMLIAKRGKNLRKAKYCITKHIGFSPAEDIIDSDIIDGDIASPSLSENVIDDLVRLVQHDIGKTMSPSRFDSYIVDIIENMINSGSLEEDDDDENIINDFKIDAKISKNDLEDRRQYLYDAAIATPKLQKLYDEYDKSGSNASLKILKYIRRFYTKAPKNLSGCDLLDYIVDAIVDDFINSSEKERKKEEVIECVDIIVADAFMKCKIFKRP